MDLSEFSEISLAVAKPDIKDQLQRTKDWHERRRGSFTGSQVFNLMKCGRSTSKLPWGDAAKLFDFGDAAEKYIYQIGMERITGVKPETRQTWQMRHGEENEPLVVEQLLKDGVISRFEECDYIQYKDLNLGASPDGWVIHKGEKMGFELKSTVSWEGFYKRYEVDFDQNHGDFWQVQLEMLVLGLDKLLYVAALPMQSEKYKYKIIEASPIHQRQLLKRYEIANQAIELWKEHPPKKALQEAIANFQEKAA